MKEPETFMLKIQRPSRERRTFESSVHETYVILTPVNLPEKLTVIDDPLKICICPLSARAMTLSLTLFDQMY